MNFDNPIHQVIYDQVVKRALDSKQDMVKAYVLKYDEDKNTADVEFYSPYSQEAYKLSGVPIQITGGFSSSGPFEGDHVWVQFLHGGRNMPRIVSIADEDYKNNTRKKQEHPESGAYVPDSFCGRDGSE